MKKDNNNDKYLGLTEDEFKRFSNACHRTFDYIAGDLLQCVAEHTGKDWMSRKDVIEVTLDAGRLLHHGEGNMPFRFRKVPKSKMTEWERFYHERLNPWIQDNYFLPKFHKLMKEVFPFERYGN